jgi:acetyl-CoA carboxylase alpha subunit
LQENIRRNFGMPQPNGYRKAMRFMRHANKFGLPIVTFVDTPGAYAGKNAEELGQVRTASSCYFCQTPASSIVWSGEAFAVLLWLKQTAEKSSK